MSFEVIADDERSMCHQAEILSKLSNSVLVKIPNTLLTELTIKVIEFCVSKGIK